MRREDAGRPPDMTSDRDLWARSDVEEPFDRRRSARSDAGEPSDRRRSATTDAEEPFYRRSYPACCAKASRMLST